MFETLFGAEMPLAVRFFLVVLVTLALIGSIVIGFVALAPNSFVARIGTTAAWEFRKILARKNVAIAAVIALVGVALMYEVIRGRQDTVSLRRDLKSIERELVDARADLRRVEIQNDRIKSIERELVDARADLRRVEIQNDRIMDNVRDQVKETTRELRQDIGRWAGAAQVPTLRGLRAIRIGAASVKVLPFNLTPGVAVVDLIAGNGFDPRWQWRNDRSARPVVGDLSHPSPRF